MTAPEWRRLGVGLGLTAAVAVAALRLRGWVGFPRDAFVPGSVVTHSAMVVASLLLGWRLVPGGLSGCGLRRGTYRFRPSILLWALPTGLLGTLGALTMDSESPELRNVAQSILFIWIYSSVSEEIFTRGFLQGFLEPLRERRVHIFRRWPVSVPILVSAVVFGGMHVVLWPALGPVALIPMTLATGLGFVAGHYRERTGSLIPAFVVHLLFNLGGMTPGWLVGLGAGF